MKVEFHSGVAEPLGHACRLLRKAHAAGARVAVHGPGAVLDRLDQQLWTFDQLSFVPHLRLRSGMQAAAHQRRTPMWLVDDVAAAAECDVLINLGEAMAPGWDGFARVIEVVPADVQASAAARQRWRQYAARDDVELVHHALSERE